MGLEAVLNWIFEKIHDVLPFFVVQEYEEAALLRLGKFKQIYKKGIRFKIPLADSILKQNITTTTLSLPAQSVVTNDDKSLVVKGIVKYKVVDTQTFLMEVYDAVDAISDVSQGIIKEVLTSKSWEECRDVEIDNTITKKVRAEIKKFGVYIDKVTLTDIAPIKSLRLFNESLSFT